MVNGGPFLRMPDTGNIGACLRPRRAPESGKLGKACRLPPTTSTPAKVYLNFLKRQHRPQRQRPQLGYIDIGIKGYQLGSSSVGDFGLCSSQTVRDAPVVRVTTDPTAGGC